MNFIKHPSNNQVFGAPEAWDQSSIPCDALPVTLTTLEGYPQILSYWVPTPEELAALNAGKPLCLSILGSNMPPVMLSVETGDPHSQG